MILQAEPGLREAVIRILANGEALTAKELSLKVTSHFSSYSLPAVYKELQFLQREGVLAKAGKLYSLKLTWVINTRNFFEQMYATQLGTRSLSQLVPDEGESRSWTVNSIRRADDLWEQLVVAITTHSNERTHLAWAPHSWAFIIEKTKQDSFTSGMEAKGNSIYQIIGSETPLDIEAAKLRRESVFELSYAESPFHKDKTKYIDVIGEYIITIRPDAATFKHIEEFFAEGSLDPESLARARKALLAKQMRFRIKVEHNSRRAAKFTKQFNQHWGLF